MQDGKELIPMPEHLFVYGTLRSGFRAHHVLAGRAERVGMGRICGRLYATGAYPAAVEAAEPGDRIRGELYRLPTETSRELLRDLDRYEGFVPEAPATSLFVRVEARVALEDGGRCQAWVYLFNRSVHPLTRIPSGDYGDHVRGGETA
jgi:gamma-glutamylcyclotransferase (GGCT)/AIG2-like uncharacterized protein YtfP